MGFLDEQIPERRYPRREHKDRLVLYFGKNSEVSQSIEISEGGMLTVTKLNLSVKDILTVHFVIQEADLRARAEVIYILPKNTDGLAKIGLKFHSLYKEYREIIRNYSKDPLSQDTVIDAEGES